MICTMSCGNLWIFSFASSRILLRRNSLTALRDAQVGTLCLTHVSTDLDERRGDIQMLFERELSGTDAIYLPEDGERIDL